MDNSTFNLTEVQHENLPVLHKSLKYEYIRSLSPGDFMNIRRYFEYYGKDGVRVDQFICIMLYVMFKSHDYDRYASQILSLVELFIYIDHQNKQRIRFEQLTNFVIENQDLFANDQSLENFKITPAKNMKDVEIYCQKVFALSGYEHFSILDTSQKSVNIIDSKSFKTKETITIGGSIIINVVYIKKYHALALSTNDKHLNFYDIDDKKLIRRFVLEQAQVFLQISESKRILFSGSTSGSIYTWSLDKIFSEEKIKETSLKEQYLEYLHRGHRPIKQYDGITYMLNIEAIEMLVTGCNDTNIRLYEVRENGLVQGKTLEGHEKGIKCLAYSESNKVIISCAFDFDVLVWNAYLDCPVAKLTGHEASLYSVYCPKKHPIIISLDSKGIMKIWNCKTFQLIQNVVSNEVLVRTSVSFSYKEELDLAILCMKKLSFFQFSVSYIPRLTDDLDIQAIRYSHLNLQIYIGTGTTIKAWSAEKGVITRTFKKLVESDIVCMELDKNHRRLFFGSIGGQVLSIDVFTGLILNRYAQHSKQVCYVGYSKQHSLLVTAGWDRCMKIHNDTDQIERIDKRNNVLRNIKNCHSKELIMANYSDDMMLLATCSHEPTVRIWDFEKGFFEGEYTITEEISCIHFINPFPLLAVADIKGGVYIFIVAYHKKQGKLLTSWTNMYSIQKQSQITFISSEYHKGQLRLIIGDEYGYVRLVRLNPLLEAEQIVPIVQESLGIKKNPYRIDDYNFSGASLQQTVFTQAHSLQPYRIAKQVAQIKAHLARINYAQVVRETLQPSILTVGDDHLCKLWSEKGIHLGTLKQGLTKNDSWRFTTDGTFLTKEQQVYKSVFKNLKNVFIDFQAKDRAHKIPFSADSEIDYDRIQKVQSSEIQRDLRQVDEYLRKYYPKSDKKIY